MEYWCFFNSYMGKTRNLSDKELGQVVRALTKFNSTGELEELEGRAGLAFDFIVEDVIAAQKKYAERCKKASSSAMASHANASERSERTENAANAAKQKTKNKKEKEIISPNGDKEKSPRHRYGEYQNVLLSDEELETLKAERPNDWEQLIDRVSSFVASTGKSYKNYLATIRNWVRRDEQKKAEEEDMPF